MSPDRRAPAYRAAIVGATGLVGETLLRVLAERSFPLADVHLFATARSAGSTVSCFGRTMRVEAIPQTAAAFPEADVIFFAAGESVSRQLAPALAERGSIVIDKSAAFRLDPAVPLVVPEVNIDSASGQKLIANPNCSTIPLALALHVVQRTFGLRCLSVATYQSVSGAGKDALAEFEKQAGGSEEHNALPRHIAGNVFPEIGPFDESGYCEEEQKIALEFRKITNDANVAMSATTVRVPVKVGHSEAIAFQTIAPATRSQIADAIAAAPGVRFSEGTRYATALEVAGTDDVFVGRLRPDHAHPGGFLAWVVCDNLRKGAATNAIQIAEALLAQRPVVTA